MAAQCSSGMTSFLQTSALLVLIACGNACNGSAPSPASCAEPNTTPYAGQAQGNIPFGFDGHTLTRDDGVVGVAYYGTSPNFLVLNGSAWSILNVTQDSYSGVNGNAVYGVLRNNFYYAISGTLQGEVASAMHLYSQRSDGTFGSSATLAGATYGYPVAMASYQGLAPDASQDKLAVVSAAGIGSADIQITEKVGSGAWTTTQILSGGLPVSTDVKAAGYAADGTAWLIVRVLPGQLAILRRWGAGIWGAMQVISGNGATVEALTVASTSGPVAPQTLAAWSEYDSMHPLTPIVRGVTIDQTAQIAGPVYNLGGVGTSSPQGMLIHASWSSDGKTAVIDAVNDSATSYLTNLVGGVFGTLKTYSDGMVDRYASTPIFSSCGSAFLLVNAGNSSSSPNNIVAEPLTASDY